MHVKLELLGERSCVCLTSAKYDIFTFFYSHILQNNIHVWKIFGRAVKKQSEISPFSRLAQESINRSAYLHTFIYMSANLYSHTYNMYNDHV